MSFFDSVGTFFGDIGNTVGGFFSSVEDGIGSIVGTLHQDVRDFGSGAKEIIATTVSLPGTVVNGARDVLTKGEDVVGQVGTATVKTVGDVGVGLTNFLSSPSFMILAGLGAYLALQSGSAKKFLASS